MLSVTRVTDWSARYNEKQLSLKKRLTVSYSGVLCEVTGHKGSRRQRSVLGRTLCD